MVEISIARYETLIAAERDAATLKRFLEVKVAQFSGMTYSEIHDLLDVFSLPFGNTECEE